ncbi:MAG: hypothetical protein AAGB46_01410 [Verrucomicrobiota bacterium]
MSVHPDAAAIFAEREAKPLTLQEESILGKWAAQNSEINWEILRLGDGSYELVYREEYEGEIYNGYVRGIWGIDEEGYYYADLESSDLEWPPEGISYYEEVVSISENEFRTVSVQEDGEELESNELKVTEFKMDLWNVYGRQNKP